MALPLALATGFNRPPARAWVRPRARTGEKRARCAAAAAACVGAEKPQEATVPPAPATAGRAYSASTKVVRLIGDNPDRGRIQVPTARTHNIRKQNEQ